MEFKNKVEVRFPGLENGHYLCDSDCPIGQVYDFACTLKAFSITRMQQEKEEKEKKEEKAKEV